MKKDDPKLEKLLTYLHNIDIRRVLDEQGIFYSTAGKNVSEGWIGTTCPFCEDPSNHLGINLQSKSISCFSCGQSGTAIKFLSRKIGYGNAVNTLLKYIPKELIDFSIKEDKSRIIRVEIPPLMTAKSKEHFRYIKKERKFNPKELFRKYQLQCIPVQFIPEMRKYSNRIFVPIFDHRRLVTFTTIDIRKKSKQRYTHHPDELSIIPIKHLLYGIEFTNGYECIVVEGLFDMYRIGDGAVCVFGTKVTNEQIELLRKFSRVKLCFDADTPGRKASKYVATQLAAFTEVLDIIIPAGDDPDKLSKKDRQLILAA